MKSWTFLSIGPIPSRGFGRVGLCGGVLLGCFLCACVPVTASPPSAPTEGIDLSGVEAWHHLGLELRASVQAGSARFPEGLGTVELQEARITLVRSELTFQASEATIDLETLEGSGQGAVVLEGEGFRATAGRFHIAARGRELELSSPVQVEVPGA